MHCSTCHYEYESWATQCPDCGATLAVGPLPEPVPLPIKDYAEFRDWGVLTNVPNTLMGNLLKDQLEQAGIPVLMKRSRATDIAEFSHNDWVMHDLYVPQRYARRARQFLQSTPSEGYLDAYGTDADWDEAADTPQSAITASGTAVTWHLIDSPNPMPLYDPAAAGTLHPALRNAQLHNLSYYRTQLEERKRHQPAPETQGRVIDFPNAGLARPLQPDVDDAADESDAAWQPSSGPNWIHSRVYRILMGLLLLAWVLPLLLQLLQNFGDTWLNWLK